MTYATRAEALAAKQALDGRVLLTPAGPRELVVEWALRTASLRLTDISPEVSRSDLDTAISAHGEVESLLLQTDAQKRPTGCAVLYMRHRAAAARLVRVCTTNMLILGGCVVPIRVSYAPGALDDVRASRRTLAAALAAREANATGAAQMRDGAPVERVDVDEDNGDVAVDALEAVELLEGEQVVVCGSW